MARGRDPALDEEFLSALYRGGELLAAGKMVEAREYLEKAHGLEPKNEKAQNLLGLTYFKLGLFDEAARIYELLVRENPIDPTLRVNLGLVYLKTNDLARCVRELSTAVDLDPSHQKAHNYLGLALAQTGDYSRAREHFHAAGSESMAEKMTRALVAHAEVQDGSAPPGLTPVSAPRLPAEALEPAPPPEPVEPPEAPAPPEPVASPEPLAPPVAEPGSYDVMSDEEVPSDAYAVPEDQAAQPAPPASAPRLDSDWGAQFPNLTPPPPEEPQWGKGDTLADMPMLDASAVEADPPSPRVSPRAPTGTPAWLALEANEAARHQPTEVPAPAQQPEEVEVDWSDVSPPAERERWGQRDAPPAPVEEEWSGEPAAPSPREEDSWTDVAIDDGAPAEAAYATTDAAPEASAGLSNAVLEATEAAAPQSEASLEGVVEPGDLEPPAAYDGGWTQPVEASLDAPAQGDEGWVVGAPGGAPWSDEGAQAPDVAEAWADPGTPGDDEASWGAQSSPSAAGVGAPDDSWEAVVAQAAEVDASEGAAMSAEPDDVSHLDGAPSDVAEAPQPDIEEGYLPLQSQRLVEIGESSEWVREPGSGPFHISAGGLAVTVNGELRARLDGLVAMMGQLEATPEVRRRRGRATNEAFGEPPSQLQRIAGHGIIYLESGRSRFFAVDLVDTEGASVDDEGAYLREGCVFAFEEPVAFENGHLTGEALRVALVHLKGQGKALLRLAGEMRAMPVPAGTPMVVPLSRLVGWFGRVTPRLLSFGGQGAIELTGEGYALLESPGERS